MNQSTNYNFNLPEGTDLVNLLTQLIPNWSTLDTLLKGVEDQAFTNCTEVVSLGVHAITRSNADGKILKWIASANYTAGDTFTVDGNLVAAATASGEALSTDAIVSGAVIIAALNADESAMTIFVTGTNVASDSAKLGGQLPSYYAKESDMSDAKQDITDLDNLMGNTSISAIGDGTVTGAIADINSNLSELNDCAYISSITSLNTDWSMSNLNGYKRIGLLLRVGNNYATIDIKELSIEFLKAIETVEFTVYLSPQYNAQATLKCDGTNLKLTGINFTGWTFKDVAIFGIK